ncbi:MAG: S9 family peptidase, partial [Methanosarcinales archaeon]
MREGLCVCSIRGGGEYGEEWHKAGMGLKKQNCFDDMCECANELIKSGVTTATQLGIMGGSNGGLLVLACALQRPHLFRAIVSQVPVADMLRFHLFTVGALWRGEYGFSETSAEDFHNMLKYSPYHNVRPITSPEQQLPAVLITTADHDDRVVPLHSFKMIAELQHVAGPSEHQKRPLLTRIETQAGHGAGKPTSKVLDEIGQNVLYSEVYDQKSPGKSTNQIAATEDPGIGQILESFNKNLPITDPSTGIKIVKI